MGFQRHPVRAARAHATLRLAQYQLERLSRQKGEFAHFHGDALLLLRGDNKQGNPLEDPFSQWLTSLFVQSNLILSAG